MQLLNTRMPDASRKSLALPESVPWTVLRDHLAELDGAQVTGFLTPFGPDVGFNGVQPQHVHRAVDGEEVPAGRRT